MQVFLGTRGPFLIPRLLDFLNSWVIKFALALAHPNAAAITRRSCWILQMS
jgi:hypothetical protein